MAMSSSVSGPMMALFVLGAASKHANWKVRIISCFHVYHILMLVLSAVDNDGGAACDGGAWGDDGDGYGEDDNAA